MLNLLGADVQTSGATPRPATPLTFNAAYVTSLQQRYKTRIDNYRDATLGGGTWVQAWGPAWDAAVAAGTVPAQIVGLFLGNVVPWQQPHAEQRGSTSPRSTHVDRQQQPDVAPRRPRLRVRDRQPRRRRTFRAPSCAAALSPASTPRFTCSR